jgi:hypothetical protein
MENHYNYGWPPLVFLKYLKPIMARKPIISLFDFRKILVKWWFLIKKSSLIHKSIFVIETWHICRWPINEWLIRLSSVQVSQGNNDLWINYDFKITRSLLTATMVFPNFKTFHFRLNYVITEFEKKIGRNDVHPEWTEYKIALYSLYCWLGPNDVHLLWFGPTVLRHSRYGREWCKSLH